MKTEYTHNGTYITTRTHKHNNMNAYTRTGVYLLSNTNIWWTYIYIYIYLFITQVTTACLGTFHWPSSG